MREALRKFRISVNRRKQDGGSECVPLNPFPLISATHSFPSSCVTSPWFSSKVFWVTLSFISVSSCLAITFYGIEKTCLRKHTGVQEQAQQDLCRFCSPSSWFLFGCVSAAHSFEFPDFSGHFLRTKHKGKTQEIQKYQLGQLFKINILTCSCSVTTPSTILNCLCGGSFFLRWRIQRIHHIIIKLHNIPQIYLDFFYTQQFSSC